ncbi:hypothetical protein NVI2019_PEGOAJLN_03643 [Providencia alcalifaciens]|uniref:Flippase n=2 Tax=Providencia alcalifaciens TaxID=126385 RepID=A0A346CL83_9GAMM|nr:oligosaccharide flippase family protein [Providencia alcalifaciens]AXL96357.1 flippase [Providencia alcalifaciens]EUD04729.1 polysaccharide biosynthesis protein [Providencia alcalifaciens RIMD 1656011]EUD10709.1 polysaccharide biosynthesis protein [Providencia alcalifaciens 205/92]MTC15449.1 oligosaccharide flippase family protein [Providencia alcalifaciens]MTC62080.1 oligosaccharide flippase family protein [Providencia alcalifaciens]
MKKYTKHSLLTNFLAAIADKLGRMFLSFFFVSFMAKNLDKENFGLINYIILLCSLAITFTWVISSDQIVNELHRKKNRLGQVIGTSIFIRTLASFLTLFLFLGYAISNYSEEQFILIFLFSISIIVNPISVVHCYFRYKTDLTKLIKLDFISFITITLLKIFVIVKYKSILLLTLCFSLEYIVSAIIYVFLFYTLKEKIKLSINPKLISPMLKVGFPLLLGTFTTIIFTKIDRIVIKFILGLESVADYSIAVTLTEVWWTFPILLVQIMASRIIYSSKLLIHPLLKDICKIISSIIVFIIILTVIFGGEVIDIVYSSKYSSSYSILIIYMFSTVFIFWDSLNNQFLIKVNKEKTILMKAIIGLLVNLSFCFILIHLFGIIGAAISTLLAYFISWLSIYFLAPEIRCVLTLQVQSLFLPFPNIKKTLTELKKHEY